MRQVIPFLFLSLKPRCMANTFNNNYFQPHPELTLKEAVTMRVFAQGLSCIPVAPIARMGSPSDAHGCFSHFMVRLLKCILHGAVLEDHLDTIG